MLLIVIVINQNFIFNTIYFEEKSSIIEKNGEIIISLDCLNIYHKIFEKYNVNLNIKIETNPLIIMTKYNYGRSLDNFKVLEFEYYYYNQENFIKSNIDKAIEKGNIRILAESNSLRMSSYIIQYDDIINLLHIFKNKTILSKKENKEFMYHYFLSKSE